MLHISSLLAAFQRAHRVCTAFGNVISPPLARRDPNVIWQATAMALDVSNCSAWAAGRKMGHVKTNRCAHHLGGVRHITRARNMCTRAFRRHDAASRTPKTIQLLQKPLSVPLCIFGLATAGTCVLVSSRLSLSAKSVSSSLQLCRVERCVPFTPHLMPQRLCTPFLS